MTSLTSIITFWRQQRCVNIILYYVHAKNNNPRMFVFPNVLCIKAVLYMTRKENSPADNRHNFGELGLAVYIKCFDCF